MATGSARCGTQCPSRVKLRSTDLASGLPFNLQQRKRLRQAGAAGECQLPTSGEPPLTTAIEPSRSSSLSDGLMPHCRHCLAPLAGPQWVEAAIHFGLDWPRCPDRNLCSRGGSDGYARNRLSIKRLEQRLRFFENWRTETLGEPAIDRRQQFMRFGVLALVAPHPGEAGRGDAREHQVTPTLIGANAGARVSATIKADRGANGFDWTYLRRSH